MSEKQKSETTKTETPDKPKLFKGEGGWKDQAERKDGPLFTKRKGEGKHERRIATLTALGRKGGATAAEIKAIPGVTSPIAHILKMSKEFGYGIHRSEDGKFTLVDGKGQFRPWDPKREIAALDQRLASAAAERAAKEAAKSEAKSGGGSGPRVPASMTL